MSTIILRKIERISSAFLELLMRRNMMMWLNGVNMWRFSCGEIPEMDIITSVFFALLKCHHMSYQTGIVF